MLKFSSLLLFPILTMALMSPVLAQIQDEHPCGNFKEEIPKDWTQGTVEVPENPDDEGSKKLKIFYYGKIQKDKTPVVFFNGGPGQHSHDAFYILTRNQKIFDPKGKLTFFFSGPARDRMFGLLSPRQL